MKDRKRTIVLMKIFYVILLVSMMTLMLSNTVFADSSAGQKVDELLNNRYDDDSQIGNMGNTIIQWISTLGIIVAVVVLLILGIKYMVGSASEKAEYKKTMIPYLIGAVLIFGASAIAKAVIAMSETLLTSEG